MLDRDNEYGYDYDDEDESEDDYYGMERSSSEDPYSNYPFSFSCNRDSLFRSGYTSQSGNRTSSVTQPSRQQATHDNTGISKVLGKVGHMMIF
jgi:hypothetical protein